MKFILGLKLGMSQMFDESGNQVAVTLIEAGPCQITQVKTKEKPRTRTPKENKFPTGQASSIRGMDGYEAIQIGFKKLKAKKVKKPQKQKPFRYLREFRGDIDISKYKIGEKVDVSIFQPGDVVKVAGVSKGKGFQGAVKRWGVSGRNATHGVKHEQRTIGSVGSSFPERVIKGKKMAGRMGFERTTVKNLPVLKVDKEKNLLVLRGSMPGVKGTLLEIRGLGNEAKASSSSSSGDEAKASSSSSSGNEAKASV